MAEPLVDDEGSRAVPVDVPVVAIGASAGGITALQKLFEALRQDLPFAFVLLQHLPAGQPSSLANLVARWTSMSVRSAADGTRPESNCVYVPSPDDILTLEEGVFHTRPAEGGGRRPGIDTIDAFFESLALRKGPRPIAVILSGTGMDGTAGAVRIRQADGVVIVQDPLTALHDGMPSAVIQRGIHDHILPVGAIAQQLVACSDPAYVRPAPSADWASAISQTLNRILSLVRQKAGFDLSGYKPSPLLWRIQQRMDVRRVLSFDDYAFLVEDDPIELEALVRGIPIHVTGFFRDPDAWNVLKNDVLLPLMRAASEQRPLRAWTPACSTGEEAYSLAMLLNEAVHDGEVQANFQVFATDAAPEILAQASRGLFRDESLAALSATRRARYFYSVDRAYRVKRFLRERMVFAQQDLISDPPFSGLDLVTCRNLLIYLEPDAIRRVLFLLHSSLRMGGYLFLGKSEAYQLGQLGFEAVSSQWNIYRKVGPMPDEGTAFPPAKPAADISILSTVAHRAALEQLQIPSVLIDDECIVLRLHGSTENILSLPAGEPTHNLIRLVPHQWAPRLEAAVRQVQRDHEPLTLTNLHDRVTGQLCMSVRLTPMRMTTNNAWDRMLVSFIREPDAPDTNDAADACYVRADDDFAAFDWGETRVSRDELEASREELQALNEELKASNAQLNTSNDALNEVNIELQEKISELEMQGRVLLSGVVMTCFLDRELKLRWFTPAMREVLRLRPTDIGRNIASLARKFHDRSFFKDIEDVLHATEPRDAVVCNDDDKWFLRRTYPYRSASGATVGVAITFADITDRTRAEVALRRSQIWLSAQKGAFQAAMNGASLDISLGILIRTLISQAQDERRCAFYIAEGNGLRHVVGMSDSYARHVDGFRISPESLACGLAVATGEPVITRDVLDEPRWHAWTWLAVKFGYRGCWSFPVETSEGSLVGSLAMYFAEPRMPSPLDLELAAAFTQTAAIIIWRHLQADRPEAGD
jgi:two-component system, chemotaxis family, CheB/CheR fusion protein